MDFVYFSGWWEGEPDQEPGDVAVSTTGIVAVSAVAVTPERGGSLLWLADGSRFIVPDETPDEVIERLALTEDLAGG